MFFFAPNPRYRVYTKAIYYIRFLTDILRGRFHKGTEVEDLEKKLADKFVVPYAITTPMARMGIYLALKHTIQPGKKVIMSPYTIADVINMVIAAKGIPLFADINRQTCNIDPKEIEKLISPDVGAVLITHLHGLSCPLDEIYHICEKYKVPLLEDCAQAFGTRHNGYPVGSKSHAGIYSLGMYKNINCWYGGVVLTHNAELAREIKNEIEKWPYQDTFFIFKRMFKSLRADIMTIPLLFKTCTFWIFRFGFIHDIETINKLVRTELDTSRRDFIPETYKGRLTPYQARLVLEQIDNIDNESLVRIDNARLYHSRLSKIPHLITPPDFEQFEHIFTYYPVQYEKRDELIKWMMKNNCDIAAQHLKNCADLNSFSEFYRDCPQARATAAQVILLPTYPRYGSTDVEHNIRVIQEFFAT